MILVHNQSTVRQRPHSTGAALRISAAIATLALVCSTASAQVGSTDINYGRAEQLLNANLHKRVFGTEITPKWLENDTRFWYRVSTSTGPAFHLVDPDRNIKRLIFESP